jgi:hypothetical protein
MANTPHKHLNMPYVYALLNGAWNRRVPFQLMRQLLANELTVMVDVSNSPIKQHNN